MDDYFELAIEFSMNKKNYILTDTLINFFVFRENFLEFACNSIEDSVNILLLFLYLRLIQIHKNKINAIMIVLD